MNGFLTQKNYSRFFTNSFMGTQVTLGYLDKSSKVNAQLILPVASNLRDYHPQKSWRFIAIKHKNNMNFVIFVFFLKQH